MATQDVDCSARATAAKMFRTNKGAPTADSHSTYNPINAAKLAHNKAKETKGCCATWVKSNMADPSGGAIDCGYVSGCDAAGCVPLYLEKAGFKLIYSGDTQNKTADVKLMDGDIIIIAATKGTHRYGHIQIYVDNTDSQGHYVADYHGNNLRCYSGCTCPWVVYRK